MSNIKFIIFGTLVLLVIVIGIEYAYGIGKCCQCCETKTTTCGDKICKVENCTDGCCRCSFIKEYFHIDIYFWK